MKTWSTVIFDARNKRCKLIAKFFCSVWTSRHNGTALTLVGQHDRKLYERTNKVFEAAGGTLTPPGKGMFRDDAATRDGLRSCGRLGDIASSRRMNSTYFPTPHPDVVDRPTLSPSRHAGVG